MVDHDAKIAPRFLEDEVICMFGVPKYIIIDNGSKWFTKFNQLCKNYVIIHQDTTLQWPPSVMGWFEKLMDPKTWAHCFVNHTRTCVRLG